MSKRNSIGARKAQLFELGRKHALEGRPYKWRKHPLQDEYYRGYHSVTDANRVAVKPPRNVFEKWYRAIRKRLDKLPGRISGSVTQAGNWYVYFQPGMRSKKLTYISCLALQAEYGGTLYHITDVEE